jgi:DNA polymerase-3 subunit gamma/tau
MSEELYRKHRPTEFEQMVGQKEAVKMLLDFGKRKAVPHFLMFTGPSGCGKTTMARILRMKMKCGDSDYQELNTADFRGIDMVREIRARMNLAPMSGKVRMWLVDEAHKLTGDAQNAFLKMLEDPPSHVYFMLATTEPNRLLQTIRTRATEIKMKPLKMADMAELLDRTAKDEVGSKLVEEVRDKIIDLADGSPRKALVLFNQIMGEDDEEGALAALAGGVAEREGIDLARMLLYPKTSWPDVAKLLKVIPDLETAAEGIRRLVLAYMSTVALGGGKGSEKAIDVIDCFSKPYYDTGKAGLILSCWDATGAGK